MRSRYEVFAQGLIESDPQLSGFVSEFHFAKHLGRKWRLDFAWPELKVGVEIDGGVRMVKWQRNPLTGRSQPVAVGRHAMAKDYAKSNMLAELGWRVLRFNPDMMRRPADILSQIRRVLHAVRAAGASHSVP
jgi:very-short-patch-repair endonuclease